MSRYFPVGEKVPPVVGGMGNGERDNAFTVPARLFAEQLMREGEWRTTCIIPEPEEAARTFATGATRDTEAHKLDFEGFISPLVLERYAEYMNTHRIQSDGTLRSSDNWQKGIPDDVYMKSLCRHFMEAWKAHRTDGEMEDALCAIIFNAMGYLYERVRPEAA